MPILHLAWAIALAAVAPTSPERAAPPIGARVGNLALRDGRGALHELAEWRGRCLLVVAFVAADCPLSELYAGRLAGLAGDFGPGGVAFVGVAPHRLDTFEAIDRFAKAHRLPFPVYKDGAGEAAARLGVDRVPSVVVLDEARRIRYRGRIDDQYTLEARRASPKARDLAGAIEALLAGRPVERPETEAVGCPIGRSDPSPAPAPSFGRDVAPILVRRCVSCHTKGRGAPFSLATYRQAARWSEAIAEAVEERRMPPWHADPEFGTFANDAHLSDLEVRTLVAWARGGCPEGEPTGPLRPADARGDWSIPGPDLVVSIPRTFAVPAEGVLDYQEFLVDPGFLEDRWISSAEIRPGNRSVVHHCNVFLVPPGTQAPSAAPDELGSYCLAAMAQGTPPMTLPPGMAKRIPAGWRLLFVLHYTPNGTAQTDRTSLGLTFAPRSAVSREVATELLCDPDLRIPPHAADHRVERTWRAPADVLILAFFPHMHLRGKSFRYEAEFPDGTSRTLLSVPRYDFHWQHRYVLATPERLPAGTVLRCVAHYDNSAANPANPDPSATVLAGKQSRDEMFNGYFDVAPADQDLTRPLAPRRASPPRYCLAIVAACGLVLRLDRRGRARR